MYSDRIVIMQIVREIRSRNTFLLFLKAKSTLRRWKIKFRRVAKYADAFHLPLHFQQKCLFHQEYQTKFEWIWFSFWSARKVGRCQLCRGLGENDGEGREIENVCTVRRGLAIAGVSCLFSKIETRTCTVIGAIMRKRENAYKKNRANSVCVYIECSVYSFRFKWRPGNLIGTLLHTRYLFRIGVAKNTQHLISL